MASLADRINNGQQALVRDAQGNLVQNTKEDIQTLAKQQGLNSPPITPGTGSLIGANQHQERMIGSPAQKTAALNLSNQATLQQSQRVSPTGPKQDVSQQTQDLEKAKKLGETGSRVQDVINAHISTLSGQTAQLGGSNQLKASGTNTQAAVDTQYKAITDAVASGKPVTDPGVVGAIQQLATLTGMTTQQVAAQVQGSQAGALQSGATGQVQGALGNNVAVGQVLPQLGMSSAELSSLLSGGSQQYTSQQIESMTIEQLSQAIDATGKEKFSQTAATSQMANSNLMSQSERQAAREQGRLEDRAGLTSIESDYGDLDNALKSADTVSVGGKQYTTEQLLGDEGISNLITQYLAGGADAEALKKDPHAAGLVQFIEKYKTSLGDLSSKFQGIATEEQAIQKDNKAAATVGGQSISDDVMKQLVPGWGDKQTQRFDTSKVPLLSFLKKSSPEQSGQFIQNMNELSKIGPQYAAEVSELSDHDMSALRDNPSLWNGYISAVKWKDGLMKLPPGDTDAMIHYITGEKFGDSASLNKQLGENNALAAYGLSKYNDLLDEDHDGKVDDSSKVIQRLQNQPGGRSLAQSIANPDTAVGGQKAVAVTDNANVNKGLMGMLADGKLSVEEVRDGMSPAEMREIMNTGNTTLRSTVTKALKQKVTQGTSDFLKDNSQELSAMQKALTNPDYDKPTVEKAISVEKLRLNLIAQGVNEAQAEAAAREAQRNGKTANEVNAYAVAHLFPGLAPALLNENAKQKIGSGAGSLGETLSNTGNNIKKSFGL